MKRKAKTKAKGSWGIRFFIILLGVTLGILFYWVLSFFEKDCDRLKGPDAVEIRREYVAQALDDRKELLAKEVDRLNDKIRTLNEQLTSLRKDTGTLQNTLSQLLSIQKQSVEKGIEFSDESRQTLQQAQSAFLANQNRNQQFNQQISDLILARQAKQGELNTLSEQIETLEKDFEEAFEKLHEKHRWKIAAVKLAVLLPVFLIASLVFMKYRTGTYWPLVWAAFAASFVKIAVVAHRHFPGAYFKYMVILVIIIIVLRLLIYLIRLIVAPKKDLLIKQYQQLYDQCRCPVCSKPIRSGPLRYIGGLKKKSLLSLSNADILTHQQPYTCPSCGSGLYHQCERCGKIRHTLLPYCEHCGSERSGEAAVDTGKAK